MPLKLSVDLRESLGPLQYQSQLQEYFATICYKYSLNLCTRLPNTKFYLQFYLAEKIC